MAVITVPVPLRMAPAVRPEAYYEGCEKGDCMFCPEHGDWKGLLVHTCVFSLLIHYKHMSWGTGMQRYRLSGIGIFAKEASEGTNYQPV